MANFLVIGSVTKDRIVIGGPSGEMEFSAAKSYENSGGKSYFTGVTLANLGNNVRIITKYAQKDESLFQGLSNPHIDSHVSYSNGTTFCESTYSDEKMGQVSRRSKSDGFVFEENLVRQEMGKEKFDAVFFGAQTYYEIPLKVLQSFKGKVLTAADLEHFLHYTETGREFTASEQQIAEILSNLDIVQLSEKETVYFKNTGKPEETIKTIAKYGPKIIILTMGERGCLIFDSISNQTFQIPAAKAEQVVDTTGAGDTFMGAFLSKYVETKSLQLAAQFASGIVAKKLAYKGAYRGN
ncbi:MAG: carbohydrate kinase family protein [Candidatus Levybacteria bacterium]|nr:carbohydrate kinase family protein [Candidatus Levybacteria bacterium]